MEIRGLNRNRQMVQPYIEYINLQWTRRYYECGEFSMQIRMEDYDPSVQYLYTPDRPEFCVIEKTTTQNDITGSYVQLSGRFYESMLTRDVIVPRYVASAAPQTICTKLMTAYAKHIPGGVVVESGQAHSWEAVDVDYMGIELDEATWPLLKAIECSQRIVYDFDHDQFVYSIWQGLDRTQSQSVNEYALITDSNTDGMETDEDESGYKNYAVILMPDKSIIECDARTDPDEDQRRKFFDYSSMSKEDGQTDKQFRSACIRKAKEELQNWPRIVNVQADTIQDRLFYLTDYDLGDKCDVVDERFGKSYESRIIEVREVFKEGQHSIEVVFGDKIPTIYERVKNR